MIQLTTLRELTLEAPSAPGRPAHLAAASGLVHSGDHLLVVGDDELHLAIFPASGTQPGTLTRIWEGQLPDEPSARKRHKPDLESLVLLPPTASSPHGLLLALGSCSTALRVRGAQWALGSRGELAGPPVAVELSELRQALLAHLPELNLEGAAVSGSTLRLLLRGNNSQPNWVADLDLSPVLRALQGGHPLPSSALRRLELLDLGEVDGVRLSVTDASPLPDGRLVVSAVCEDTADSFHDGPCSASALALLDEKGRLAWLERLEQPYKVEGIHAHQEGEALRVLMVCDADDPSRASPLLSADLRAR